MARSSYVGDCVRSTDLTSPTFQELRFHRNTNLIDSEILMTPLLYHFRLLLWIPYTKKDSHSVLNDMLEAIIVNYLNKYSL